MWHLQHHREVIGGGIRIDKRTFCCCEVGVRRKCVHFGFFFQGNKTLWQHWVDWGRVGMMVYYKQRSTEIMCSVPVMYQSSGTPLFRLPLESWSGFIDLEIQ